MMNFEVHICFGVGHGSNETGSTSVFLTLTSVKILRRDQVFVLLTVMHNCTCLHFHLLD